MPAIHSGAEQLHRQAIAVREKALGPDHPDLAQSLNNLGMLLIYKKDYAQAEPLKGMAPWVSIKLRFIYFSRYMRTISLRKIPGQGFEHCIYGDMNPQPRGFQDATVFKPIGITELCSGQGVKYRTSSASA